MISSPERALTRIPIRLPKVPLLTKSAASLPKRSAAVSWSWLMVGSSPKTSSPSAAAAIASRISGLGIVSVSERMSTAAQAHLMYLPMNADLILAGGRVRTLGRRGLLPSSHLAVAGGLVVAVGGREVLGLKGRTTRVGE